MKKIFLAAVVAMIAVFSANAQVKIESPHPDLDVEITRCAYSSGTVVVDMVVTNFGKDEMVRFRGSLIGAIAYDDDGNQYDKSNSTISVGLTSSKLLANTADVTLPQDVPLKFRVEIQDVSSNATKLMMLKIPLVSQGAMGLKGKSLVIRNLEWAK